jgi:predicted GIY-YIG superfamily endonuclease
MAFMYILRNAKGMTYVGVSRCPLARLKQHNSQARSMQKHYTNRNRPWRIAAVFDGFATRGQALRAEYMVKHKNHKIRHTVAIVSRIATAIATCTRLLRVDSKFTGIKSLRVIIWESHTYQAVCLASKHQTTSSRRKVTVYQLD